MQVSNSASRRAAQLLKKARKEKQLTGVEAAIICNLSGSQYSRMENGLVRFWGTEAIVGAAEIMDLAASELQDILNDAPPPVWQKRQDEIHQEALEKLNDETLKIISAAKQSADKRLEVQRDYLEDKFRAAAEAQQMWMDSKMQDFIQEVSLKVNSYHEDNVRILEQKIEEAGAAAHEQLKNQVGEIRSGGQALFSSVISSLDEAKKQRVADFSHLEQMINDHRTATTHITADMESELANLKRIMVRIEAAVDSWYQIHTAELEALTD